MATTVSSRRSKGLDSNLKSLSLDARPKQSTSTKGKTARSAPPPDSWEEEADSDPDASTPTSASPTSSGTTTPQDRLDSSVPGAPPPTPMSPTHRKGKSTDWSAFPQQPSYLQQQQQAAAFGDRGSASSASSRSQARASERDPDASQRRPEKSSAAAGRMIAGALGVKTPRMGEEARKYERAVRDNERKRVEKERGERERAEREKEEARRAVWDD